MSASTPETNQNPPKPEQVSYHHLDGRKLWDWYSIDIETKGNSKFVFFNSKIHMTSRAMMNPQFSNKFTDDEILRDRDLVTNIINRYSVDIWPCKCHDH